MRAVLTSVIDSGMQHSACLEELYDVESFLQTCLPAKEN